MTVYLLHFDRPFGHATHYLGFAEPHRLIDRLSHHRQGTGSNLCKHVAAAGIGWQLSRLWEDGSRTKERQIKNQGGKAGVCPLCDRHRLRTPSQRIASTGHFIPVLSMNGSVVHAGAPDSPLLLCGRAPGDEWRILPSDDAAVEVSAIRRPGCARCLAKIDRFEELKAMAIDSIHRAVSEADPPLIGKPLSEWTPPAVT